VTTKILVFVRLLTADEVGALKRGTGAIYVKGFVAYRDASRRRRRTNYLYMYGIFTGTVGITTEMTIAEKGNTAY
jgi:hypothetical protein